MEYLAAYLILFTICLLTVAPVSYTHLDVYKRQGQSSTYTYNALNVRIKNVQVRDNKNAAHANSDLKDGSHGTDYRCV